MSDSLRQMSIFAKVVASGSLSAAARELGLSPAVVSRSLSSSKHASAPGCFTAPPAACT